MSTPLGRISSRALVVGGFAMALAAGFAAPAYAHDGGDHGQTEKRKEYLAEVDVPLVSTPNVHLVTNFPDTAAISGVFAKSAPYFYVSSTDSISVFDVSDPLAPRLTGTLSNLLFENEAMNYGEQTVDGKVQRFVLLGVDLVQASPGDIQHVNVGGGEVVVVDVTDPANPHIRSRVPDVPTSTHTVACIHETDCRYAYTAGTAGRFSIIDLTDPDAPKVVHSTVEASPKSPAAGPNAAFSRGAGHKWNFDEAGYGIHTGSGGTAIFDARDPVNPKLVTTNDAKNTPPEWNDFIHHNSARPNADKFAPGTTASVNAGNVVLVTEEDYENTECSSAGSFQTWYVSALDGTPNAIQPLDKINPVDPGEGVALPNMAFCSAHWFDYHPSGIVAEGFYEGGLRLIDVRNPRKLTEYGYFASGLSEVWDAYWVPVRNSNGVATGAKTNIVYTADLVRGLDVFTVDLPGSSTGGGLLPLGDQTPLSGDRPLPPVELMVAVLLGLAPLSAALVRRRRTRA